VDLSPPREKGRLVYYNGKLYLDNGSEFVILPCRLSNIRVSAGTDVVVNKSDSEVEITSTTYAKAKEIYAPFSGYYTVYFEMHCGANTPEVYGTVYRNGVAYGKEHSLSSTTYVGISEDLYFDAGDLVELYVKGDVGGDVYVRNFRLLCSDKI